MEKQKLWFRDLGIMDYQTAWDIQEALLRENVQRKMALAAAAPDGTETLHHLLFVEHPPVYTLGKSGKMEHVRISDQEREEKGIAFFQTNRGGDITFHGPDQIVGYPIIDLEKFYTDIGRYLRNLEEVVIRTLSHFGVRGERSAGETGVWIDAGIQGQERKICAMGVRCSRWITMHGFALNVNTDLGFFDHIIPCGIQNKRVTSLQAEVGATVNLNLVKERLKKEFEAVFDVQVVDERFRPEKESVVSL